MKLIVIAPRGQMGRAILRLASERKEVTILGGVARKGSDLTGKDLGEVARIGRHLEIPVVDRLEEIIEGADVVIDFSTPEALRENLPIILQHKKALMLGTTGLGLTLQEEIKQASEQIPILIAPNTSRIMDLFFRLVEQAALELRSLVDIEILEMHGNQKKDAPSGTSKHLGEELAAQFGTTLQELATYGRVGPSKRVPGTIGYHSLRLGDVASSHSVYFGAAGERMEITHHAQSMDCFATGALDCAVFLCHQKPGLYSARDAFTAEEMPPPGQ